MFRILLGIGAVAVAYKLIRLWIGLRLNLNDAKRSGLPYIVAPWAPYYLPWQMAQFMLVPVIKSLPSSCWEGWLEPTITDYAFRTHHEWFAKLGEAFLVVSPGVLTLLTDNAEVIRNICQRRETFTKWMDTYDMLRQFGENVLTTEGAAWRMHRKATSASFNETNTALVFSEAIRQTQGMLRMWTGPAGGTRKEPLTTLQGDTRRLALNIIGYVGFGIRMLWPGETPAPGTDPKLAKYSSLEPRGKHKISFVDTMEIVLDNIITLLMVPAWILKLLPYKGLREAAKAHREYVQYMDELLDGKIEDVRRGERAEEGMDLMGQLAQATYGEGVSKGPVLSREEIIGNAFLMFVAGHESTANTLFFTLVELATAPDAQRKVQRDVDQLVGDADPSTWNYDALMNPMTASMVGASMYETLRLIPPAAEIPKELPPGVEGRFVMDGTEHVLSRRTIISLAAVSAHTNPRYWPAAPSKITAGNTNILDYVPERWLQATAQDGGKKTEDVADADEEDLGGSNAQFFRPERGAYVPFSDGPRGCLGRRIAVAEIVAALAVILQRYSIELAVDEWASPEQVETMGRQARACVYEKAQEKSRWTINQAESILTLRLHGHNVPVRLVKRGEEKFVGWMDAA